MHLIHTLETGGAQKVIVNLIRGMDKSRFDLTTVCMQKKGPVYDEIKKLSAPVIQIPKRYRFDPTLIHRIKKFIIDEKIDILHSHNFSAGLWGRLAVSNLKKRRPITVHTEHGRTGGISYWRKIIVRYLARYTDKIISVSEETHDFLVSSIGIHPAKIDIIKNGIDLEYLISQKDLEITEINEIIESNPEARFVVNVSALSPVKDHTTLIRAFEILRKEYPSAYLLLVGDGSLRLELKKLVSACKVTDRVHFLGERHDVAAILNKSDIFVLSSLNEGHPISLLEAMGMGVVPVATNVGGIPELIENTGNGLTVQPSDPSMLASAIKIPLENDDLFKEWSQKSAELIANEYTAEVMSSKHEELYLHLLNENKNH